VKAIRSQGLLAAGLAQEIRPQAGNLALGVNVTAFAHRLQSEKGVADQVDGVGP
jgi:hypothetical protein